MNNTIWKRAIMVSLVAVFAAGAVLTPTITKVFAAEQITNQEQQDPSPGDGSQEDNNDHSAHHHQE